MHLQTLLSQDLVTSRELQRVRRIAKRSRALNSCVQCKAARAKCNDCRPCTRCRAKSLDCADAEREVSHDTIFACSQSLILTNSACRRSIFPKMNAGYFENEIGKIWISNTVSAYDRCYRLRSLTPFDIQKHHHFAPPYPNDPGSIVAANDSLWGSALFWPGHDTPWPPPYHNESAPRSIQTQPTRRRPSSPSPPRHLPPPLRTPLLSLQTAQPPLHQPVLRPSPPHHASMLHSPGMPHVYPAAAAAASAAAASASSMCPMAAAAREEEALRQARLLVLATAAEVAAGGGRAAAEAILAATLGPDGRGWLSGAGVGPAAGMRWP
jgi:hypothetical protein